VEENVELALSYEPMTEAEKGYLNQEADSLFSQPTPQRL